MIDTNANDGFVITAYTISVAFIALLVVHSIIRAKLAKRALKAVEHANQESTHHEA